MTMDGDLKSFLVKQGLHNDTVDFLEKSGCLSQSVFATWVDEGKEWTELVNQMPTKDRLGEAPRLKAAWKQMYSNEAVRIRKESEGVAAQDFGEPLPAHVYRDMMGIAVAYYRWQRYSAYSILCDGQIGRLRRECQAYQPTTFKVAKGRIQALMPAVASAKRKHLAEDLTMLVGPEEVEDSMANDLWNWCEKIASLGEYSRHCRMFRCGRHRIGLQHASESEIHSLVRGYVVG